MTMDSAADNHPNRSLRPSLTRRGVIVHLAAGTVLLSGLLLAVSPATANEISDKKESLQQVKKQITDTASQLEKKRPPSNPCWSN